MPNEKREWTIAHLNMFFYKSLPWESIQQKVRNKRRSKREVKSLSLSLLSHEFLSSICSLSPPFISFFLSFSGNRKTQLVLFSPSVSKVDWAKMINCFGWLCLREEDFLDSGTHFYFSFCIVLSCVMIALFPLREKELETFEKCLNTSRHRDTLVGNERRFKKWMKRKKTVNHWIHSLIQ